MNTCDGMMDLTGMHYQHFLQSIAIKILCSESGVRQKYPDTPTLFSQLIFVLLCHVRKSTVVPIFAITCFIKIERS